MPFNWPFYGNLRRKPKKNFKKTKKSDKKPKTLLCSTDNKVYLHGCGAQKGRNESRFADTGKKCDLELFCSESSGLFFVLLFLLPTRQKKVSVGIFYSFHSERLREEEIPIGEIVATIQPFPLQVWILDGESSVQENSPFRRWRKERSNSALATLLCGPSVKIDVFSIAHRAPTFRSMLACLTWPFEKETFHRKAF